MRIDLPVEGMHCASCAARIEQRLRREPGVRSTAVNFATRTATVDYAPEETDAARLAQAIHDAGYAVVSEGTHFPVEGISCAGCVARIEAALRRTPGVLEAAVNFATKEAMVSYLSGAVTPRQLHAIVNELGYHVPEETPAAGAPARSS